MPTDRKAILEALGLVREEDVNDRFMMGMLVGVGIGALVGGVVAMLMAPKSGSELRSDLTEKGRDLMDKARGRTQTPQPGPV
jgi:hypothetical protein